MKNILVKAAMLLISVCCVTLVGCSTNTRGENTAVGAVSGGVLGGVAGGVIGSGAGAIAAGAVAGGLLGGVIGYSMDSSDTTRVDTAMDNNPPNYPTHWRTRSGAHYSIAPTSHRMHVKGHGNCRRYYGTVYVSGKKHKVSGVACRQANGHWMAVTQ